MFLPSGGVCRLFPAAFLFFLPGFSALRACIFRVPVIQYCNNRGRMKKRTDPPFGTVRPNLQIRGGNTMKEPNTIWKCAECGIVFEALQPCEKGDDCIPACCGRGLTRMVANHSDGAGEKHVPVAAPHDKWRMKVTVGAVAHPMLEAHYIQWIEVVDGDMVCRKYLKPGDAPEAVFPFKYRSGLILREYCNLHGLWTFTIP